MPTIEQLIENLKDIKSIVQDGVDRAIIGDEFDIVGLNKEQLLSGIDANSQPLGSYAESTKKIRQRRGLQTDFIDLSFTGKSQDSIRTNKISDNSFEISAEPRWDQKRFPDAIGITEENEKEVTEIVILNVEAVLNEKFK